MRYLTLLLLCVATLLGCATTGKIAVDSNTIGTHIVFLGERIKAAEAPLEAAVTAAMVAGDKSRCLELAEELMVNRHRVPWHEEMALKLLGINDDDPGEKPSVPDHKPFCEAVPVLETLPTPEANLAPGVGAAEGVDSDGQ